MNPTIIKDESEIPKGAVRVHLYNPRNVLMPRGSMKKESIGPYLLDRLKDGFEDWTDPKYGDNPVLSDLIKCLHKNLMGEVEQAWLAFVESSLSELNPKDQLLFKMSIIAATEPDVDSEYVNWLLETITSDPHMFVEAITFIDKFDRDTNEFRYFTGMHMKWKKSSKEYDQMHNEALTEGTTLSKMFHEDAMRRK
jgi:hypothetical protein